VEGKWSVKEKYKKKGKNRKRNVKYGQGYTHLFFQDTHFTPNIFLPLSPIFSQDILEIRVLAVQRLPTAAFCFVQDCADAQLMLLDRLFQRAVYISAKRCSKR
jgi:hypothetical protein